MLAGCPVAIMILLLPFAGPVRGKASTTAALEVPASPVPAPAPEQPLLFSHQQHVANLHLGCRACHTNPEPGTQMAFPATSVCMAW